MEQLSNLLVNQDMLLQAALLCILLLLALFIAWRPLRKIYCHLQLQRRIKRLGLAQISQARIAMGEDELFVEYLILQADGISLLMVRPYQGNIFAGEKIEKWTQVLGHRSYKFPNPLYELERDTQLLRAMLPKIEIRGMVIFGQGSRFPKGKPSQVYDFTKLGEVAVPAAKNPIPEKLSDAWSTLQRHASPSRHLQHSVLSQRGDKRRLIVGMLLMLAVLGVAAWQLGQI